MLAPFQSLLHLVGIILIRFENSIKYKMEKICYNKITFKEEKIRRIFIYPCIFFSSFLHSLLLGFPQQQGGTKTKLYSQQEL